MIVNGFYSREVAEKATKEIGSLFMGKKRKMRGSRTEQENYSRKWERPNREKKKKMEQSKREWGLCDWGNEE